MQSCSNINIIIGDMITFGSSICGAFDIMILRIRTHFTQRYTHVHVPGARTYLYIYIYTPMQLGRYRYIYLNNSIYMYISGVLVHLAFPAPLLTI